jgi:hypothetical protein
MKLRNIPIWSVPFSLLILAILSYGILIPWLGFYWDDLPSIWFLHFLGPSGFEEVFSSDRPLLGQLFRLSSSLLGENPMAWQSFGLLTRWLSCIALWWVLRGLWPEKTIHATWIVFLYLVYPGFNQQFISVTYSHVFIVLTTFWLSMGAMIWAIRKPEYFWPLTISSLLLSAYSLFTVEYFFGLELIRPVVIWISLAGKYYRPRTRLGKTILTWLPYLALVIGFLVWRTLYTETPRGQVDLFGKLIANPFGTVPQIAAEIFSDVYQTGISAWGQTINFIKLSGFGVLTTILYALLILLVGALTFFYLWKLKTPSSEEADVSPYRERWGWQALGLGLLSLFLAGWPFWATNLPITLEFPWDRFTLPMMFGSSLILVGFIDLIGKSRFQKTILVAVIVSLGIGWQFRNANVFRREWNNQVAMFWQLSWRAPHVLPGTLFLSSELPFSYFSDNSLTAPLNWLYSPEDINVPMKYMLYAIESRLGKGLPDLKADIPIYEPYRASYFEGTTSQALVFYYTPPGCVKILDPNVDQRLPQKPKYIGDAMGLSNPALITIDGDENSGEPQSAIYNPTPSPDWCYFYEKADLARYAGDWETVVAISVNAMNLDQRLYEVNAPEYLPYIEAHAHLEQWDKAIQITETAYELNSRMQRILCDTWERISITTKSTDQKGEAVQEMYQTLSCSQS